MHVADLKKLTLNFIEDIWNQQRFELLHTYLHKDYIDHALPPSFPPNASGVEGWITAFNEAFLHQTLIEDQVTEGQKTILKIKIQVKHIGLWRNIQPTGFETFVNGYRTYLESDGKISEHWALIDGCTLENQLRKVS